MNHRLGPARRLLVIIIDTLDAPGLKCDDYSIRNERISCSCRDPNCYSHPIRGERPYHLRLRILNLHENLGIFAASKLILVIDGISTFPGGCQPINRRSESPMHRKQHFELWEGSDLIRSEHKLSVVVPLCIKLGDDRQPR